MRYIVRYKTLINGKKVDTAIVNGHGNLVQFKTRKTAKEGIKRDRNDLVDSDYRIILLK